MSRNVHDQTSAYIVENYLHIVISNHVGTVQWSDVSGCVYVTGEVCILSDVRSDMILLCEDVHRFAFNIVFSQIEKHLQDMQNMEVSEISAHSYINLQLEFWFVYSIVIKSSKQILLTCIQVGSCTPLPHLSCIYCMW